MLHGYEKCLRCAVFQPHCAGSVRGPLAHRDNVLASAEFNPPYLRVLLTKADRSYVPLCSYIWFFKSFHTLNCCEVAGLSCASLCITVLVTAVFSVAAAGPAKLFRITMPPPYCVRFFATSALEGTSSVTDSESTLRKQIEEWQFQHQKTAKPLPHVHWLLSLAASCCGEA